MKHVFINKSFVLLLLSFIQFHSLAYTDPFYENAIQALENKENLSMEKIITLLEKSASLANCKAYEKLGEI